MKFLIITVVSFVCVLLVVGDVTHIKAAKAKVLGRLIKGKHHKRGILSAIPPYKLGHDIPLVTHSVVKPLVVTYPPTATVAAVKVPLTNPLVPQYPVGVGHKVSVPHPHYGLKFPHTKVVVPKPDHHFHHHHHHVAPKPVVPIVPVPPPAPAPVLRPNTAVAQPVPAPAPSVFVPAPLAPIPPASVHPIPFPPTPVFQSHPLPLAAPPVNILPPNHLHLKPLLPAATVSLPSVQGYSSPGLPQIPYVIRPGGSVQTSLFSTFPRFPILNYQSPLIPVPSTLSAGHVQQVLLERPQLPHYHYIPHGTVHGGILEQHTPNVVLDQTPTLLRTTNVVPPSVIPLNPPHELSQPGVHLHPTQAAFPQHEIPVHPTHAAIPQPAVHLQPTQPSVHLDHDGWSPVPSQAHDVPSVQIPEAQVPQQGHQFTQEPGTQVYEQHTEDQYHDFQQQLQHHIQQQIEQAQYEQHLNNQNQLGQEYGVPQHIGQEYGQPNNFYQHNQDFVNQHGQNFSQQGQDFSQQGQSFAQQGADFGQHGQDFSQQGQSFAHQGPDFGQHGQDFSQQGQSFAHQGPDFGQHGQDFGQHGQDFGQHGQEFPQNDYNLLQPGQEYGLPQQGVEGRSGDQGDQADQGQQQFHNHIPLGLQPPIDRPLEHFR